MDAEHLEYFKAALEGRATVGWNVWFAANQQALSQQLSRPALLRLKFNQLDEAERLLAEAGIVPASTAGKRYEVYCARFALDVLDEKGRPLPAIWRAAHDGAIGLLADGEHEAGKAKLLAQIPPCPQARPAAGARMAGRSVLRGRDGIARRKCRGGSPAAGGGGAGRQRPRPAGRHGDGRARAVGGS